MSAVTAAQPTILDAFRATAERSGDAELIRYFDATLTVAELDALSDGLAVGLAGLGVERGTRVALLMQNVPQYVIALVATWKLGAVAVACSPLLRPHELGAQLRDAGAEVLVALEALYAPLADGALAATPVREVVTTSQLDLLDGVVPPLLAGSTRARVPGAHDLLELAAAHAGERPPPAAPSPADVAVLTYTSGTTGPPKGAMNTHGNLTHCSLVYRDWARLGPADVILGIAPLFHVTGLVAHVTVGLLVPLPVVLAYRFDADEACRLVEHHRTTFTVAAVTAYTAMLDARDGAGCDLSSLTKAYSGGAPVSAASAAAWEARTGSPLRMVYGLTETSGPSHIVPVDRRAPVEPTYGALSVGLTVTATTTRILDEHGRELPTGAAGEIAIRGPQVIPGYWRNAEATAHALPGGELRTGDVGLLDDDGWLYVVDRLKDQINVSGYKVWPRDVEDVLYTHPAVREVAVVGVHDDYRGEVVKAFVALRDGAQVAPEELIAYARERLAAHKYPRQLELVPELPKTASGKILRRALRAAR